MGDINTTIKKLSISAALWNVYKQLPALITTDKVYAYSSKVIIQSQFELYKMSTLKPVFDNTSVEQLHTLGSAAWPELLNHVTFLMYLLEVEDEVINHWFYTSPAIAGNSFGLYVHVLARLMLEQLEEIGIKA